MSRRIRQRPLEDSPLVSVILATRDRPQLLATTLECYRRQTYARRELIVVDDGETYPVDPAAIEALGGRLIRVETGATLGAKLNRGASEARGIFCQKMDDDDWYAPGFLELMVSTVLGSQREVCRPTFALLKPFLFFDLAHWELRRSGPSDASGATLFFSREDWQERPFRGVRGDEDLWFFLDQLRLGTRLLPVTAPESYLAVRHRGGAHSRGHTWIRHQSGRDLDQDILEKELYPGGPEAIMPDWALAFYRDFREEMLAATDDGPAKPIAGAAGVQGEPVGVAVAQPEKDAEARSAALTTLAVRALESPSLIRSADVAACGRWLQSPALATEGWEHALVTTAAMTYARPELVEDGIAAGLERIFSGPPRPATIYRQAGSVLSFLLATPARTRARDVLLTLLARPDQPWVVYEVLLDALDHAASWAIAQLDLSSLVALAEQEHLVHERERLLQRVIERLMLADPAAVTAPLFERLAHLYAAHPSWKYCAAYLAGRPAVPEAVRRAAAASVAGQFALRETLSRALGEGRKRVLVVQNIADGQGDEIIRVVPLLEALLSSNPRLEIVLITSRVYLYTHSRLSLVPIDDQARTRSMLGKRFDGVIDFFEPVVPQVNYDLELERLVQAARQARPPFLYLSGLKGWNHFVYQRLDLDGQAYAERLGLDRQRVENIYETTCRLIAELGLPLRLGEEPPTADSILAGLPNAEAETAWARLVHGNRQSRPVVLLSPFGGIEPLKGYVERKSDDLAEQLRGLIGEGFFVVLLPNGTPWGSTTHARRVVDCLMPDERAQVAIGPDPAEGAGQVAYEHFGTHSVPNASYQMRLVTYFVRFADLVVTVEGWMAHAAYCLGKRYRVFMLPYSHPAEWHPYGRTRNQDVVLQGADGARAPTAEAGGAPPLPEQPRKFALLFALRGLGSSPEPRAVDVLRLAVRSEDHDVRLAAAESLGRLSAPGLQADLLAHLADSAAAVRSVAAQALLERGGDRAAGVSRISREQLLAHQWIGQQPRIWSRVVELGEAARQPLETALQDDDPVIRREAAQMLPALGGEPPDGREAMQQPDGAAAASRSGSGHTAAVTGLAQQPAGPRLDGARVLILTPVKDATDSLEGYCQRLGGLSYPHGLISLGFLESDSSDTTFEELERKLPALRQEFRRVGLWKRDFGYRLPAGTPRWLPKIQVERRTILAKSRNHLLFHALDDEDWVLWLDVDVIEYPSDLIERLLASSKEIVQPHCVLDYGGGTFDLNGWRDQGRLHLDDLRAEGELVELDAVGGSVLLVRADLHRDGLIYPPFLYGRSNERIRRGRRAEIECEVEGEIETEGLGIMARDMGQACWGMPHLEVIHERK